MSITTILEGAIKAAAADHLAKARKVRQLQASASQVTPDGEEAFHQELQAARAAEVAAGRQMEALVRAA